MNLVRDPIVTIPMRRIQSQLYMTMVENSGSWSAMVHELWDVVETGIGLTDHGSTGYTGYDWRNINWIAKIK